MIFTYPTVLTLVHQSVSQSARPSVHWYISQLDYSSIHLSAPLSVHSSQPFSQSVGQPVGRSVGQPVSWSVGQSVCQSVSQLVIQSLNQRVGPLINILTALTPLIPVLPTARWMTARWSGVSPSSSSAFTSAPCSINNSIIAVYDSDTARASGVWRFLFRRLMSQCPCFFKPAKRQSNLTALILRDIHCDLTSHHTSILTQWATSSCVLT